MDSIQKELSLKKQKEIYKSLTEEDLDIVNEYCRNDMQKLKHICYPKIRKVCGDSNMDEDNIYSIAMDVLIKSVKMFDKSQGDFQNFLSSNIQKKVNTYIRDTRYRSKRSNVQRDENGKPIYIPNIPLDSPTEEGVDLYEKVPSDFNMEDNLSEEIGFLSDEKVERFLSKLGKTQRDILKLLMRGYSSLEVKEKLNITDREYGNCMTEVRRNKYLSLFNKKSREWKAEVLDMEETKVLEVMEIDTTDSYRMDKYSLLSLLNKKSDGEIDCNYISQRAPFQWDSMQVNKFFTRVLNNQPIPEIIICETKEDGKKVSYLIDGLQRLSYAEWFKENRIKIGVKGAEFPIIKYRDYAMSKDGSKEIDDRGRAKYEIKTFDVVGKYYKDLPEFLQRRFDDFNVNVTTFFNCTEEMIDYHIRNYNNHCGMTKSQYGITNVNNFTSKNIKLISQEHNFFKDIMSCSPKNRIKGVLDEVVARSIMTLNFMSDWKRNILDALIIINDKATDEQYENFKNLLDRLYAAGCDNIKSMFTTTNAHIWFSVFSKFTELQVEDSEFVRFMEKFQESMKLYKNEKTNDFIDSNTYELFMSRNTKDRATVQSKVDVVYNLLLDFLHIDDAKSQSEKESKIINKTVEDPISTYDFVKENVRNNVDPEDVELYELSLEDYTVEIDETVKQIVDKNIKPFVALVAYAFMKEVDDRIPGWLVDYTSRTSTYSMDQKENYLHMKRDFEDYLVNKGAAA